MQKIDLSPFFLHHVVAARSVRAAAVVVVVVGLGLAGPLVFDGAEDLVLFGDVHVVDRSEQQQRLTASHGAALDGKHTREMVYVDHLDVVLTYRTVKSPGAGEKLTGQLRRRDECRARRYLT